VAIDNLDLKLRFQTTWTAEDELPGRTSLINSDAWSKTFSYVDSTSPTSAGGANEWIPYQFYVSTGGTLNLDLSAAMTNAVNTANVTLTRVKAIDVWLLGNGEYAGVASPVTGTLCTGIQVGGAASNPAKLFFANTSDAIEMQSEGVGTRFAIGTGGYAGYRISSGMNDTLKILNLDSTYTAVGFVGILGSDT
jgi:hypothetical protein